MDRLAVVFGDQLDPQAEGVASLNREHDAVLMMEVAEEATHVTSHQQRTVLFLSAMRHFAMDLVDRGYRVEYARLEDPDNTQSFDGEAKRACRRLAPERIVCTHPGEWRVLDAVRRWSKDVGVPVDVLPDEHFLTSTDEFDSWASGRKQLVMEPFYRAQRKRMGVLVDDDRKPIGGQWNFDEANREAFKNAPSLPRPYQPRNDAITEEVIGLVAKRFPDAPGSAADFRWPVTRAQASRALDAFIQRGLPRFGTYEDAMWTDEPFLYHSLLSSSLNLKLLDPRDCVRAAVDAYESGAAPIHAVEGFVRQIIGWREFIRGVYWFAGSDYGEGNGLEQYGRVPDFYWSGETDMNCMHQCLGQVLKHAYGHHIQRLMVTGNFALISGIHPRAISDWYLGMYVDAVDWVTLPNTLGMVMHADGGMVGTKPYAASARYIGRMSNYCKDCRYDADQRTGEDACPFNTLYWDFLIRNHDRFKSNSRMALMLSHVKRMKSGERRRIGEDAEALRDRMGIGDIETPASARASSKRT